MVCRYDGADMRVLGVASLAPCDKSENVVPLEGREFVKILLRAELEAVWLRRMLDHQLCHSRVDDREALVELLGRDVAPVHLLVLQGSRVQCHPVRAVRLHIEGVPATADLNTT